MITKPNKNNKKKFNCCLCFSLLTLFEKKPCEREHFIQTQQVNNKLNKKIVAN